jgi:drug/metabolite transporter (DMT)-like permease
MIPPITLSCLRWTLASLIFLPFAWPFLRKDWALVRKSWQPIVLLGIIGPGCYNTLSYMGLAWTSALNGLVLNAAGPIFIALVSWGVFGDRLRLVQVAGLAMGFIGVLAVIAKGDLSLLAGLTFGLGDIVLIIGMIMWSIYTACLRLRPNISGQSFSAATYGVAAIGNLPLAAIEFMHGGTMSANSVTIAAVSYTAIFPSLIAYMFYNRGVALLGATRAGLYLFLVPVFGALLAMILLGEELHMYHAAGFMLIIAGVLLGTGAREVESAITPPASGASGGNAPR